MIDIKCIKDYKKVKKGEVLKLMTGKIYDESNNWVCDMYSEEGLRYFVVGEVEVCKHCRHSLTDGCKLNVSIGEANEKGYCPYRDRWKRI
jgi:hypothetical protein